MHRLWARYVAGDPALYPLVAWPWPEIPWKAVLRSRAAFPTPRAALVEALRQQNEPFLVRDPALRQALEALLEPATFTVTTGQQLGWLTGPLYTLVKAAHTVQLARELSRTLGPPYRVVPVFWLASEDHDAEEVRTAEIAWGRVLRYEGAFAGPVGRHRIEAAFPPEASGLALQRYWQVGQRWEAAFREAMQSLFAGTGLVWCSGDDPALKVLASPLWIAEIQHQHSYQAHAIAASSLRELGEVPRLRAQTVNLFWLSDTERRYPAPDELPDFLAAAHLHPERLSPNVLLRPIYQEWLLPNLAYVSGPGEVAYWLELRPVFEAFGVPMPVLYPRGHLRVLPVPPPGLPEGLSWEGVWQLSQNRLRALLAEWWGREELQAILAWADAHRPPVEHLSEKPFLRSAQQSFLRFWEGWRQQLRRATLRAAQARYQSAIEAVLRYRASIEPEGRLQERSLNVHAFAPQDPTQWVQRLLKEVTLQPGRWTLWQTT